MRRSWFPAQLARCLDFFGFAFGLGGVGSTLLGKLTDITSINFVYHAWSFLLVVGILSTFLRNLNPPKTAATC